MPVQAHGEGSPHASIYPASESSAGDTATVADTKRKVLAATADLMERLRFGSVTMDAVARASGVSRSTIYRHWPSREALVLEAFTLRTEELTEVDDSGDAFADLTEHLSKLAYRLNFGGAASTVAGLIASAIEDADFAQHYRSTLVRSRRRGFLSILRRGQVHGQITQDADLVTVIDCLYGAIHHRLLVSKQPIDDRFITSLVQFVSAGLRPAP